MSLLPNGMVWSLAGESSPTVGEDKLETIKPTGRQQETTLLPPPRQYIISVHSEWCSIL